MKTTIIVDGYCVLGVTSIEFEEYEGASLVHVLYVYLGTKKVITFTDPKEIKVLTTFEEYVDFKAQSHTGAEEVSQTL